MFFYLSKKLWYLFNPINVLFYIFFLALIFHFLKKKKLYRFFYFVSFLSIIVIGILPTGTYLLWKLENSYNKTPIISQEIDGILILGGGTNELLTDEHNQLILNDRVERLTESVVLIKKFPEAKIVFSAGSGTLSKLRLSGSDVAKIFYNHVGVNIDRINFEDNSRNTFENILFSKKFISNEKNEKWLLVTSAYHMKRAITVAEKLELSFIPYPVDFITRKNFTWKNWYEYNNFLSNMNDFQLATHEYIGLITYYFSKKGNKIF